MKPLDFSLLNVQDQDGKVEDLLFHVVSTPTNGQLVLSRNGKEVQLDKAGHFSWKDVKEKKVRFVHSKEKPRWLRVPLFSSCLLSTSALHLPHPPQLPFSPQLSLLLWENIHTPQMPNAFSCLSSFHCNCSESVLLLEAFSFYHIIMGNSLMWQESSWYNYPAFWPSRNKAGYTPRCSRCFFNVSVRYWEEGVAGGWSARFSRCGMGLRISELEGNRESQLTFYYPLYGINCG